MYKIEGFREVIFGCFWVFFEVVLEVFEGWFGGGFCVLVVGFYLLAVSGIRVLEKKMGLKW